MIYCAVCALHEDTAYKHFFCQPKSRLQQINVKINRHWGTSLKWPCPFDLKWAIECNFGHRYGICWLCWKLQLMKNIWFFFWKQLNVENKIGTHTKALFTFIWWNWKVSIEKIAFKDPTYLKKSPPTIRSTVWGHFFKSPLWLKDEVPRVWMWPQ